VYKPIQLVPVAAGIALQLTVTDPPAATELGATVSVCALASALAAQTATPIVNARSSFLAPILFQQLPPKTNMCISIAIFLLLVRACAIAAHAQQLSA
jgi:hypothetical protein